MEWNSMNKLIKSLREGVQHQTEATMMKDTGEVVHNCAKHVEHVTWGKGATIAEEHAAPDESGNIAWYDVMFEHGLERQVPTADLNILVSETHKHSVKKAVKEQSDNTNAPVSIDKNQDIKKKALDAAAKAANAVQSSNQGEGIIKQGSSAETFKEEEDLTKVVKKNNMIADDDDDDNGKKKKESCKEELVFTEEVDQTIEYKTVDIVVSEADKNYDGYFKAAMKARGIKHPGELKTPEEKKKFFNKVDAGFKAKNEDVFVEAWLRGDVQDKMDTHKKAGNKVSDVTHATRNGQGYHSFVVTEPSGKRTRHIYHGNSRKLETMSPAPKSTLAKETGEDEDDK